MYIRMSGNKINFDSNKIEKSEFYKNKKVFQIDDMMLIKYQFLKKNHTVQRKHLNTLLDIMIMMSLDHYV